MSLFFAQDYMLNKFGQGGACYEALCIFRNAQVVDPVIIVEQNLTVENIKPKLDGLFQDVKVLKNMQDCRYM
jgi:hypothetical protein